MAFDDILQGLEDQKKRIEANLQKIQNNPATKTPEVIPTYQPISQVKPQGKTGGVKKKKSRRDTTRRLTDAERLAIIAIHDTTGTYGKTAEIAGCSKDTAFRIVREYRDTNLELVERIKKGMTNKLNDTADRMIDHASENISSLNAYQATIAAGVMIDKALLIERGQPPAQVNQIQVNVQLSQLNDEIEAMVRAKTV